MWGAVYEDAGFQLAPVKAAYGRLFPVPGDGLLASAALPGAAGAEGLGA